MKASFYRRSRGLAVAGVLSLVACGGGGKGDETPVAPAPTGGTGVVTPPIKDVSGSFFLGDQTKPAFGYEVWVADRTRGSHWEVPLDENGAFSVAVGQFTEGHSYSFHLIRDHILIGDVDLAPTNPGVQATFLYEGGYGFNLGQIVLEMTGHDTVVVGTSSLAGHVGGGFSLLQADDGTLAAFPNPAFVSSASIGAALGVYDASTALYGVYQRATHADVYARMLAENSRAIIRIDHPKDAVTRAYADSGGRWLDAARLGVDDVSTIGQSQRWSDRDFDLLQATETRLEASVFVGAPLAQGSVFVVKVQPAEGSDAVLPKVAPLALSLPPQLKAVSINLAAPITIDYNSATAVNGLTRPFCQKGDVQLILTPPQNADGAAVTLTDYDEISVSFAYFASADGRSQQIRPTTDDFPEAYRVALSDVANGQTRNWDPTDETLSVVLTATNYAQATQSIPIPAALFLRAIGDAGIQRLLLRVKYRNSAVAGEAGIVVWLTTDC